MKLYSEFFCHLREYKNEAVAIKMAAYMKNHFLFLGLPSPLRKELQKPYIQELRKSNSIDWEFIFQCFEQPEREFQYIALDYLDLVKKNILNTEIENIEQLIIIKSWWDSVDCLDQIVGAMALNYPELKDRYIRKWMISSNIWLKRIAIDFQLSFKAKTDTEILAEAILSNLGSKEFFVNKAIGWSLREYSKTNKTWVARFIETHNESLSPLSIKEGSKYL